MLNTTIKSSIDRLWDKFWSGGIANPLTAIEQISYLLFMKRIDQLDIKKGHDAEFTGESYKPFFKGENEKLRWSHFRQMEGGEMLTHIQTKVFPFLKGLGAEGGSFAKHMNNAVFIIDKPSLLVEAVNIIDEIFEEISKQQSAGQGFQDTQGDVYEHLLAEISSAGKLGQFRTPRHIIQLICELVDPKLGDTICDPACGTGGFLLGAYHHILTQHTSKENQQTDENGLTRGILGDKLTDERQWTHLKEKTFYGYDMDDSMVRIGLMNLMMHGISAPNIDQKDTLSKKYDEDNHYDVVMANPPFKGSIDKGDINESFSLDTTKTELLFINRIIKSLKIGGRGGAIVPDGVLFGSSNAHKQARKMLLNDCELQGIISMPSGVFKPYAGVSTAILIFVKGGTTEKVWIYRMSSDGRSLDDKRELVEENDIPDIISKWKNRNLNNKDDSLKDFFITIDEIKKNDYNLNINSYRKLASNDELAISFENTAKDLDLLQRELITQINDYKQELNSLIKANLSGWEMLKLPYFVAKENHSIKRGPFGGSLKKEIFVKSGYKIYEQKNAINNNFDIGDYFITEEKYKEMIAFSIKPGDLIISCSGTIGKIAIVPNNVKKGIINQALLKIALDDTIVNPKYFKYIFESEYMKKLLFGVSRGSSIKNFPPISVIKSIKFPIPRIESQKEIVRLIELSEDLQKKYIRAAHLTENLLSGYFTKLTDHIISENND